MITFITIFLIIFILAQFTGENIPQNKEEIKMFTKADTLNNILGWEENTVYHYNNRYKILCNNLFVYDDFNDSWEESPLPINKLISLRDNATKHIRYYYKLRKEYNLTFNLDSGTYLNYNRRDGFIGLDTRIQTYITQTKFTEEEYISLMNRKGLNTEMFERVEL